MLLLLLPCPALALLPGACCCSPAGCPLRPNGDLSPPAAVSAAAGAKLIGSDKLLLPATLLSPLLLLVLQACCCWGLPCVPLRCLSLSPAMLLPVLRCC